MEPISFHKSLYLIARNWDLDEKKLVSGLSVRQAASKVEDSIHKAVARQIELEAGIGTKPYANAAKRIRK